MQASSKAKPTTIAPAPPRLVVFPSFCSSLSAKPLASLPPQLFFRLVPVCRFFSLFLSVCPVVSPTIPQLHEQANSDPRWQRLVPKEHAHLCHRRR